MGLFKVDMINNFSYVCSFQKRLNGMGATVDDPMTCQMGVNVNLEYKYGLQLTEGALTNCRGWLGVDVQRCIVPLLQSSPMKRSQHSLGAAAPLGLASCRVVMAPPQANTTNSNMAMNSAPHALWNLASIGSLHLRFK